MELNRTRLSTRGVHLRAQAAEQNQLSCLALRSARLLSLGNLASPVLLPRLRAAQQLQRDFFEPPPSRALLLVLKLHLHLILAPGVSLLKVCCLGLQLLLAV